MNQELNEILERSAVAVRETKHSDLVGLAQLHSDLQAIRMLSGGQASASPQVPAAVDRASILIEKLVLNEADDAAQALAEVGQLFGELQALLSGVAPANTAAKPAPQSNAAPTPKAPTVIAEERVIAAGDAQLALEFVGEAASHLDAAEVSLLKLGDDPSDSGEVNAVFRAFHTIKGVAGFLELKQIGALAHAAETLLDLARKGKLQLAGPRLDVVLEARDLMKLMVNAVEVAAKAQQAPVKQEGLEVVLQRLEMATHEGEIPTPVKEHAPTPKDSVPQIDPTAPASPAAKSTKAAVVPPPSSSAGGDAVVKVATGRLDALINAVGELVIAEAMVAQDLGGAVAGNQRLARNLSHLGKITRGLQDLSMSMRMVPILGVFQKMARLARDVSHKASKEVNFVQIGGETELDRNVVEAISDPLVHMVRNAIDHGLESPEDRVKAGKPMLGKVVLKAAHQAGNVVIEITDDGKGLNKERIVQKAIGAGIVKEGQELTEQQIFQLIFHPGLSTAEKITDISGRGVGMDVVRKNVEALRGRIEIASAPGKGSTFTIRLPLTLAVIDGLIVKVGTQRYIIPITSIEQSIRPTATQLSSIHGKGELCMVRERLLPLVRLHKIFNTTPRTEDPTTALVIIVQEGAHRCCLLVDELIGQQQVVIKSVGKEIGSLPGIAGCAILGDGNVSLILDVAGIILSAFRPGNGDYKTGEAEKNH